MINKTNNKEKGETTEKLLAGGSLARSTVSGFGGLSTFFVPGKAVARVLVQEEILQHFTPRAYF